MNKTVQTLLTVVLLGSPLVGKASVGEPTSFTGNDSNTSIESEQHNGLIEEKIDSPHGEQTLADDRILIDTFADGKIANVTVLKPQEIEIVNIHIKGANAFNCYTSLDGLGGNGLQSPLKNGKVPEISHITVFYKEKEEIRKHNIHIIYQTEDGTQLEYYKEPNVEEGSHYDVTDKANNFTIPGYELKEVTGDATSGTVEKDVYVYVIFVPIEQEQPKDEEPVIKPEEPQVPTVPQEPEVPQEPQEPTTPVEPQEPEEEEPLPPVIQEEPKEEPSGDVGQDDKEIPQFPTEEDMNTPKPPLDKEPVEEPKEEPVYKEDIDEIEPPKKEEPSLGGAKDYVEEQKPVQQEEPVQQDESDKPVTGINPIMATIGTLLTGFGIKLGKKRR